MSSHIISLYLEKSIDFTNWTRTRAPQLAEQLPPFRQSRTCQVSQPLPSHSVLVCTLAHYPHSPYLPDSCGHPERKNMLLWLKRLRTHCGLDKISWTCGTSHGYRSLGRILVDKRGLSKQGTIRGNIKREYTSSRQQTNQQAEQICKEK